jgi:hypothetical protein
MKVQGLCEGWNNPAHYSRNTKTVITPTKAKLYLCNRCMGDIQQDLNQGAMLGTFQVLDDDGQVTGYLMKPQ